MMNGGKCTCTGKDIGWFLGGCAVGGLGILSLVGGVRAAGWLAAWLLFAFALVLVVAGKWMMIKGLCNGCSVHGMVDWKEMMMDNKGKGKKKK